MKKNTLSVRAQKRRQHILECATQVFCELGYDEASMSAIAARVGGSKGTLYNYFPSKEKLLLAAMIEEAEKFNNDIMQGLDDELPLESFIYEITKRIIHKIYVNPRTAQLLRVVITVGDKSKVGQDFFAVIGDGIWGKIQEQLAHKVKGSPQENLDPHLITLFIRSLCEADIMRLLMGAMPAFTKQEADQKAKKITRLIIARY